MYFFPPFLLCWAIIMGATTSHHKESRNVGKICKLAYLQSKEDTLLNVFGSKFCLIRNKKEILIKCDPFNNSPLWPPKLFTFRRPCRGQAACNYNVIQLWLPLEKRFTCQLQFQQSKVCSSFYKSNDSATNSKGIAASLCLILHCLT